MAPRRPPMASPSLDGPEARPDVEALLPAPEEPRRAPRAQAPQREEITYDSTNERVVICAQIADRSKRRVLARSIAPDEMLVPEHSVMQRALRLMEEQNLEYDPAVFRRLVLDEGVPVDDGYIASIEADAGVPENLDWHVATLRWDATRARVIRGPVPEMIKVLKDPKASPDSLSSSVRAVLRAVEGGGGRRFIRRGDELQRSYKAEIAARVAMGNFYPTGYPAVDAKLVEGIMPKRMGLVVGLPGSGKSTWTADLVVKLAQGGRRPLMGAWEMGSESIIDVMAASMARVSIEQVVQGELSPEEIALIGECVDWITTNIKFMDNAFFDEALRGKGKPSNDRSLDLLEGYIAESGCDVIVMDLWERCLVDLSYDGITRALYRQQDMLARYNVYGLLVHQLKLKDVESRPDKRPTREAIKGTGAFVEVVDQIYGIHRDAQFKRVADDALEVICLKQRKGRAFWSVRFDWDGSMGLITGGDEVPYDPGLEASHEFGDVADVKIKPKASQRKPSRREA